MIFITTSNGVFLLRKDQKTAICVMSNKHTPGLFKRKAKGYFGICLEPSSGAVLVASREKLGSADAGKPSTDSKLHRIDPVSLEHKVIAELHDLHDVHQIASHGNRVYLTDTGKNRVHVYDLEEQRLVKLLNIGERREDIHHLNAVYCEDDHLLIGLNNRGEEDSAILSIPYSQFEHTEHHEIDALAVGSLQTHTNIKHTHDIENCHGNYLVSASHAGYIFSASELTPMITINNWVRGICCDDDGIWVGTSPLASRKERHSEKLESCINQYSYTDYILLNSIRLPGSGQVNDLLYIPD